MSSDLFVSYLSADGLSDLDTQRTAVANHLGRHGRVVAEVVGGSDLSELRTALELCHQYGATLLMAELGAWSDDPTFLRDLGQSLRRLNLRFSALDRPEASELTLGIMAAVAGAEMRLGMVRNPDIIVRRREFYARFTAERRKCAAANPSNKSVPATGIRPLSENRGRGTIRSRERAEDVAPLLVEIRAAGAATLEQVANALNALGIPSSRGNRWYPMQVTRIEKRLSAAG